MVNTKKKILKEGEKIIKLEGEITEIIDGSILISIHFKMK